MSPTSTSRSRASLALGTALALTAASLTIGINPASATDGEDQPVALAAVTYATVTGHAPQSSIANQPSYWCPDGRKIEGRDLGNVSTYLLPAGTYSRVIVKAGAGPTANTIFAAPPQAGQTVWGDWEASEPGTNEGPGDRDKTISHIIVCPGPIVPEKTDLTVTKVWDGEAPNEFLKSLTNADAGGLSVTVAGEPILEPTPEWESPIEDLPVDVTAEVSEGDVPPLPGLEGYRCAVTGSPEYSVNGGAFGASASFKLLTASNTVTVRNTVDCTKVEKPTTTLTVLKQWVPGNGVPPGYPKLDSTNAGTLAVTIDGKLTNQSWNDTKAGLPIGVPAVVSETKPTLAPFAGYECTVSNPSYVVNGGSATDTAVFKLEEKPNTVTVVNAFDCKALVIPPPTTSLTVTKTWAIVGGPTGYALATTNAGPLTVTVGGTATGQAWGATTKDHAVGAAATVSEGTVPAIPQPSDTTYTCALTNTQYAVNAGAPSTTASFTLAATPNTVVVTNTVTCTVLAVVDEVEDEVVVEDIVDEDTTEESAVAGSEDELAATGGNTSAALLGALLVLSGAALIGSRRRFGMND